MPESADATANPESIEARPASSVRVLALTLSVVLLGGLILSASGLLYVSRHPEYSLANLLPAKPVWKPNVAPPESGRQPEIRTHLAGWRRKWLRQLFEQGEFDKLNAELAELQEVLETDTLRENEAIEAFRLFTRPGDGEMLDKWAAHDETKFQPLVSRAEYCMQMAWRDRGTAWAGKTSPAQIRRMRWWLDEAQADMDAALAENPMALNAHLVRIEAYMADGDDASEMAAFDEAQAVFTDSLALYETIVHANRPRWGGDYQEMNRLAMQARSDNLTDMRFYVLFGMIYEDQAQLLRNERRDRQAIELYTKALGYGETGSLYEQRATTYLALNDPEAALADSERALELNPYSVGTRLLRTTIFAMRGDNERAAREAHAANDYAPDDPKVQEAMVWVRSLGEVQPASR